jgi:hypothetical protein
MLRKMSDEMEGSGVFGFLTLILLLMTLSGKTLYCLVHVLNGKGHETFKMPMVDRLFTWIDASYMDVLILDGALLIALIVGLIFRYFYYSDERDFLRKYKIKDKTGFWGPFRSSDGGRDYPDSGD